MQLTINIPVGAQRILSERADYHGLALTEYIEQQVKKLAVNKINGDRYRKDQCPQGHEYTPENVYINTNGGRLCRQCRREKNLARYYRDSKVWARDPSKGRKKYDSQGQRIVK